MDSSELEMQTLHTLDYVLLYILNEHVPTKFNNLLAVVHPSIQN